MHFVLALDQGTTSSRAIVFDRDANIVASAQREFRQIYPESGWVEHDPLDLLASQFGVAVEALAEAGLVASDIAVIGITNQRETTIVWDRATGVPVCNAIVWQDRRSAPLCDALKRDGHEALFAARTGLVLDPYFSGTKIRWILDHVVGARAKAEAGLLAFGTVDSWLIWHLSGRRCHVTDPTNASRTLLYDIHRRRWDDELLALVGVPRAMLPEVRPSSGFIARAAALDARLVGGKENVLRGIPIAGVAGDQQAALFGQACFAPGMVKNTYGTGCFMLMNTGAAPAQSTAKLLSTLACTIDASGHANGAAAPTYALEGSVFVGGAVVQWLRDELGMIASSADVEALAASVPDSGGVVLVPAFAGLGTPYWDPYARGALVGITRGTTKAHIARAALDAIAFQVRDVLEAMRADTGIAIAELRVDGGASVNDLLMQLQADLLDVPVVRPTITETTALGAAYLAGLAVGVWKSVDEIAAKWKIDRVFEPAMEKALRDARVNAWSRAVERARGWAA